MRKYVFTALYFFITILGGILLLPQLDSQAQEILTDELTSEELRLAPLSINTCFAANARIEEKLQLIKPGGDNWGNFQIDNWAYETCLRGFVEELNEKHPSMRVISAYRSIPIQARLWQLEREKGFNDELISTYLAQPGCSEHHLGTTIDICVSSDCFENPTAQDQALWNTAAEVASKHGAVLSYPKELTAITGIKFEPWHFRCIGKDLASQYKSQAAKQRLSLSQFLAGDYEAVESDVETETDTDLAENIGNNNGDNSEISSRVGLENQCQTWSFSCQTADLTAKEPHCGPGAGGKQAFQLVGNERKCNYTDININVPNNFSEIEFNGCLAWAAEACSTRGSIVSNACGVSLSQSQSEKLCDSWQITIGPSYEPPTVSEFIQEGELEFSPIDPPPIPPILAGAGESQIDVPLAPVSIQLRQLSNSEGLEVIIPENTEIVATPFSEADRESSIFDFAVNNNLIYATATNFSNFSDSGQACEGICGGAGDIGFNKTSRGISVALVAHPSTITADTFEAVNHQANNYVDPNGQLIDTNKDGLTVPAANSKFALIYFYPVKDDANKINQIIENLRQKQVVWAVTGVPILRVGEARIDFVYAELDQQPAENQIKLNGYLSNTARTIIGWQGSNLKILNLRSANMNDMVRIINQSGFSAAISLDGGGTTQSYYDDATSGFESLGVNHGLDLVESSNIYWPSGRDTEINRPRLAPHFIGVRASESGAQISAENFGLSNQLINSAKAETNEVKITEPGLYEFELETAGIERRSISFDPETESISLRFFHDNNLNQEFDEGDELIGSEQILAIEKQADVLGLDLNSGWNAIALPVAVFEPNTNMLINSGSQLAELFQAKGANILHLARLNSGKFDLFTNRMSEINFSDDFQYTPGQGLMVFNAGVKTEIVIEMRRISAPIQLNLSPGWNLVALTRPATNQKSLSDVFAEQETINSISSFQNGTFNNVVKTNNSEIFGNQFNLSHTSAYFLRSDQSAELILD